MPTFDTLLRDLRGQTPEIDVATLSTQLLAGQRPTLIDVREADEHAQGIIPNAVHIPRGFLELRIEKHLGGERHLQQLEAAVGAFDPALKDGGSGRFVVRFGVLWRRQIPDGLGHGPSIRSLPGWVKDIVKPRRKEGPTRKNGTEGFPPRPAFITGAPG